MRHAGAATMHALLVDKRAALIEQLCRPPRGIPREGVEVAM